MAKITPIDVIKGISGSYGHNSDDYFATNTSSNKVRLAKLKNPYKGPATEKQIAQQQKFKADAVSDLYPEYFILKVNDFNRWSKVPLDQWLYFLATSDIPEEADAPGLQEAREKLNLMKMNREEQAAYDRYLMERAILRNTMVTAREEGLFEGECKGHAKGMAEGRAEGRAEGNKEGRMETAKNLKAMGLNIDDIVKATGLTVDEVAAL